MTSHGEIQQEIDEARAEVKATVHDLATKLDVPRRVKRKARDVTSAVEAKRAVVIGVAAAVAGGLVVLYLRHRAG